MLLFQPKLLVVKEGRYEEIDVKTVGGGGDEETDGEGEEDEGEETAEDEENVETLEDEPSMVIHTFLLQHENKQKQNWY